MNYRQHRECELLNSTDGRSLVVNLEAMRDELYRIMGRGVNDIPIWIRLKVRAILEPRGHYK